MVRKDTKFDHIILGDFDIEPPGRVPESALAVLCNVLGDDAPEEDVKRSAGGVSNNEVNDHRRRPALRPMIKVRRAFDW